MVGGLDRCELVSFLGIGVMDGGEDGFDMAAFYIQAFAQLIQAMIFIAQFCVDIA